MADAPPPPPPAPSPVPVAPTADGGASAAEYQRLADAYKVAQDIGQVLGQGITQTLNKSPLLQIQADPIERTIVFCTTSIPDVCWSVAMACVTHYLTQVTGVAIPAEMITKSHIDASDDLANAIDGLSISDSTESPEEEGKGKEKKSGPKGAANVSTDGTTVEEAEDGDEEPSKSDSRVPKEFQVLERMLNMAVTEMRSQVERSPEAAETVEAVGKRVIDSPNYAQLPPRIQSFVKNTFGLMDINLRLRAEARAQCLMIDPIQRAETAGLIERTKESFTLLGRVIVLPERKPANAEDKEPPAITELQRRSRDEKKHDDKYAKKQKKRLKRLLKLMGRLEALNMTDPEVVAPLDQQLHQHFGTLKWPFIRTELDQLGPDGRPLERFAFCNIGLHEAQQKLKNIWADAVKLGAEVELDLTKAMDDLFSPTASNGTTISPDADRLARKPKEERVFYDLKNSGTLRDYLMLPSRVPTSIVPTQEHLVHLLSFQWLALELIRKQYSETCNLFIAEGRDRALDCFRATRAALGRSVWTIANILIPKRMAVDKWRKSMAAAVAKHRAAATGPDEAYEIDVAYHKRYIGSSLPASLFFEQQSESSDTAIATESVEQIWRDCFDFVLPELLLPPAIFANALITNDDSESLNAYLRVALDAGMLADINVE